MRLHYDEEGDVLCIELDDGPVAREVSFTWNSSVALLENGELASVTVLDAAKRGVWPLEPPCP